MKLISWDEWLDKHIPYYEADRHRELWGSDPPQSVLIISPPDKIKVNSFVTAIANHHSKKKDYETVSEQISKFAKCQTKPLFLERDTRQEWYWAFWNEHDALLCMFKMT